MLPSGAIFGLTPKCMLCGRGFVPDLTGEDPRAPRPLSWFSGSRFAAGIGGNASGKEEKGRGSVLHFV